MSSEPPRHAVETPKGAAFFMIGAVLVLWALEIIDQFILFFINLDHRLGLRSWELTGLLGVVTAPLMHLGFKHLMSNSLPFVILGFLILVGAGGLQRFIGATLASALGSGLFAWVLNAAHTVTVGASGIVFGWLTYLILRGVFARNWRNIIISIGVLIVYGGVLWGVFPTTPGVSWQGHLGGAIAGALAAWWMHHKAAKRADRGVRIA